MPRLSLYRPQKGSDYKFFDKTISEMFTVGGVDINLHKYLGPANTGFVSNSEPGTTGVTSIQDLLFLENRDRKYDTSVYTMRTLFRVNDSDFDLTQFGLFLTGDTIFAVFHLNDMIDTLGRKIMVGDVIEIPVLKDYWPLDDAVNVALKRYYVVQDATRAAEGFSPLWYPHLWRIKLQPLVDSQEYKDILNQIPAGDTDGNGVIDDNDQSLGDLLSTYNKLIAINDAVVQRAEDDVPKSGYDTSTIYTLALGPDGLPSDPSGLDASQATNNLQGSVIDASSVLNDASDQYLTSTAKVQGYLTGDGLPPNGYSVAAGLAFPMEPSVGDYYLRLDYVPNRLFRYDGRRWAKIEDAVRTNLTPGVNNKTQLSGFINDTDKFMSNAAAWDGIRVASPYTPPANSSTVSFTLSSTSPYATVVTNVPYVSSYGVRTKLNSLIITNTVANTNGNISFTITSQPSVGDLLEYTVYRKVINQRQSLSQALRPSADNL
jgi:hypothetical protein